MFVLQGLLRLKDGKFMIRFNYVINSTSDFRLIYDTIILRNYFIDFSRDKNVLYVNLRSRLDNSMMLLRLFVNFKSKSSIFKLYKRLRRLRDNNYMN